MSQSNPKFDLEFPGDRGRRSGLPNTAANLSAGQSHDPTEEIRNMINDLQAIARDARVQKEAAERERDAIVGRLQDAEAQLAELREKEIEFRKQFVEISSLLRERDSAVENATRAEKRAGELEERLRVANNERADAQRQRDEAVMRVGEVARQSHDNATQLADAQRQITSIRQARDAAQNQNLELNTRLRLLEEQLTDAQEARDDAERAAKKADDTLGELRVQLDSLTPELTTAKEQMTALTRDLEAEHQQNSALARELEEHRTKLAELGTAKDQLTALNEQVTALTRERDEARAQRETQTAEIEQFKKDVHLLRGELTEARLTANELETLQRQLAEFATERDTQLARQKELVEETSAQQSRLAMLTEQLAAAQRGREEALTSLNAAQKQIDHIIRDRDQVRQQGIENALELEKKIDSIRSQATSGEKAMVAAAAAEQRLADAERRIGAVERERESFRERAEQSEKQRLLAVELTAQLDTARRELIRITAELAEARLQARSQASSARPQQRQAVQEEEPLTHEISIDSSAPANQLPRLAPTPLPDPEALNQALTEKDARSTLGAIKRCYQAFTRNSEDTSLLNELHCHLHYFAERARISGCVALHRLGDASAAFVQSLYRHSEQVTGSAMRTIGQTIDFLGILLKQRDYAAIKDPSKAVVYVVDDDADNCEAIRLGLETVGLRTQSAQEPSVALSEIANGRYDLIFLDVNMPNMDGFDLCQHIRQLAIHVRTPIVFLTGLATVENRVQSSISGANDFIAKPFNIAELSVKTLTLILKASISQ